MHAGDPINWKLWNRSTLQLAAQENRPILLSSGYFACHWCHVMQKENYQNTATAEIINRHFIAVKIDRELNPELDNVLVDFSKQTTGQGGWPQHVLLTPQGYPFSAFIYLPNSQFNQYLTRAATLWEEQSEQIKKLAEQPYQPRPTPQNFSNRPITQQQLFEQLTTQLLTQKDDLSGGLKASAKFPRAPLLNALLGYSFLPEEIDEWLQTTLNMIQSEHLNDHIYGGFYRYTIDPEWQTPHFEKMTYNSALLAQSYLLAGVHFTRQDYTETAERTLAYLRVSLYNPQTGLYQSSQSAIDHNGIEGGAYLWSKAALKEMLDKDEYRLVSAAWHLDGTPPYEQGWHPKTIQHAKWPQIQAKLTRPETDIPTDSKSIISWNGLILSALSLAYHITKKERYKSQAFALAMRLADLVLQDSAPRAVTQSGEQLGRANLEDYAYALQGLLDYQKFTSNSQFASHINRIKERIVSHFYHNDTWQYDSAPLLPIMHNRSQNNSYLKDGALPSPLATIHCLIPGSLRPYLTTILANPIEHASFINNLNCKATSNSVQ